MKLGMLLSKKVFLNFSAIIFLMTAANLLHAIESDDEEDDSPHYSLQKQSSDIDEDSDDEDSESLSDNEEELRRLRAESWGPTAERLLFKACNSLSQLDHLEHEDDLKMLLDAVEESAMHVSTRDTLATVLSFFGTEEALVGASKINYNIALDQSLSLKERENAAEDLERINLPECKKLAYEAHTALAKDNQLPCLARCKFAKYILWRKNMEDLKHALQIFKVILEDGQYDRTLYPEILSGLNDCLSDFPDLYKYSRKKIIQLLGSSKLIDVQHRFLFICDLLEEGVEGYNWRTQFQNDSKIELEVFNSIKKKIPEEEFKANIKSVFAGVRSYDEKQLENSYMVIHGLYSTQDNEIPPLRGNIIGLLNLTKKFDYAKEYEEAKKRIADNQARDFFELVRSYKPTRNVLRSIIEDARSDPHIMDYLKKYYPNLEEIQ